MDGTRKSRKRFGITVAVVAVLLLIVGSTSLGRTIILRQYDAIRLASFARRVAQSDRAVATGGGSTTLTFTGAELEKILRGVSSGKSSRMPDAVFMSSAVATVVFLEGTNTLGEISLGMHLFNISPGVQFLDTSTLLNQAIISALRQKRDEEYTGGMK